MVPAPTVSVVTIFLDAEPFLAEAIDSVLAQDFTDWELILVDDGSSDGSAETAQRYAMRHPQRIRYMQHPGCVNRGVSASRNLGIAASRGEFIAMLDADDVWLPGLLTHHMATLRRQPDAQMVFGPVERWFSWDPCSTNDDFTAMPFGGDRRLIKAPALVPQIVASKHGVPLGVTMRRAAIDAIGGYADEFTGLCEDRAFFTKFCLRHPVYFTTQCGYRCRQHDGSSVRHAVRDGTRDVARIQYLRWALAFCRTERRRDRRTLWALRRELVRVRYPQLGRVWAWLSSPLQWRRVNHSTKSNGDLDGRATRAARHTTSGGIPVRQR
jgi:hypothetical protein